MAMVREMAQAARVRDVTATTMVIVTMAGIATTDSTLAAMNATPMAGNAAGDGTVMTTTVMAAPFLTVA